jgi:hypothetical protein
VNDGAISHNGAVFLSRRLTTAAWMAERISITETIYRRLIERVLAGAFAPGARIDVNEIAAEDGVSPTPVRNALNRLAGAGFIDAHSNEGFFALRYCEQDLRDLYDCCAALLGLAISRASSARPSPKPVFPSGAQADLGVERRTEALFEKIMSFSANRRLSGAFAGAALLLRPARIRERDMIANREAELQRIAMACEMVDLSELGRLIGAYHRRRIRLAPKIIALMQDRETADFLGSGSAEARD